MDTLYNTYETVYRGGIERECHKFTWAEVEASGKSHGEKSRE